MAGPLKNPRHEQIAILMAAGETATKSYVCVYESEKGAASSARRLLKNARFCARVEELQTAAASRASEKSALSRAWVLEKLMENVRRAMQEQPVLDSKGRPTGEYRYEGSVANTALIALGKEVGLFVDRSVQTVWNGQVESLTAEQLARLTQTFEQIAAEQAANPQPEPEQPSTVQ